MKEEKEGRKEGKEGKGGRKGRREEGKEGTPHAMSLLPGLSLSVSNTQEQTDLINTSHSR